MIWIFLEFDIMQLLNLKESFILKMNYKKKRLGDSDDLDL